MEAAECDLRTMVSQKEYERRTEAEWKLVTVKTLRDLQNGYLEVPRGTVCSITRKYGGFGLKTEPCKCCGVRVLVGKVPFYDVTVVEGSEPKNEKPFTSREEHGSEPW